MYIPRHIEKVVNRMSKRKAVIVLTGARQVGKSTMFKENYKEMNYVTLNRPLVRLSAKENPTLFFQMHKPPVIVDEVQKTPELFDYIPELFDYIKDVVDEQKVKGQFYLTASQSTI